jgi:hypothetical protein
MAQPERIATPQAAIIRGFFMTLLLGERLKKGIAITIRHSGMAGNALGMQQDKWLSNREF